MLKVLEPVWEKRNGLSKNKNLVKEVLVEGTRKAKIVADETLNEVKAAIGFSRMKI